MTMTTAILSKLKKRPVLIVGGLAGCGLVYLARRKRQHRLPEGDIWLDLDLSQPLTKTTPGFNLSLLTGESNPLSVRDVVDALETATKDDRVRGILGRFSYRSWGGGYLGCVQEVRDAVGQFRASAGEASKDGKWGGEKERFSIAVADTFGEGGPAVGEYYLASAFEKVLLQPSGYVGVTGSGVRTLFARGFLDKYGIKPEVFNREEYKSFAEGFTEKKFSKASREALTSVLAGMLDDVAYGIAQSRGFEEKKDVYAIMQACPLPANEALSMKLVDGMMYPHDADRMVDRFLDGKPPLDLSPPPADASTTTTTATAATANGAPDTAQSTTEVSSKAVAAESTSSPDDSGSAKCTKVSIADYIKVMRANETKVNKASDTDKYVAVINVGGPITRHAQGQKRNTVTSSKLCEILQKASKDTRVGAVVLRIDSGGGSAVASDSIAAAVERLRQAGKPVVCSMGDVAASGGYMIASACDSIVAQPATITGSIGVVSLKLSFQRLLKTWGVEVDSIDLGENHLAFSPFTEFTPKQRTMLDQRIGEIYDYFVDRVAKGRNLSAEKVLEVAKGRVWTGRQAQERGLVDQLGGLNTAINIARKAADLPEDAVAVTTYPIKPTLGQMFSRFIKSDAFNEEAEGFGLRDALVAVVEVIAGAENVASLSSAVSLLASVNDVANGKAPRGSTPAGGHGELEADDIDFW